MGRLFPGQTPPPPSSTGGGAAIVGGGNRANGPGPFVMACSSLEADIVVNDRGDELGRLEHIMIDVASGRVAYAVLAHGGVFGIGERLFAIPWRALTLDAQHRCFVLPVARDRFDRAPGFDRQHWPAMGDPAWAARIHDFYGLPP